MRKKWKIRQNIIKKISKRRIAFLLDLAKGTWKKEPELAKRYVQIAFGLVKKNRVKLSVKEKFSFCRKCLRPWVEGETVEIEDEGKLLAFKCACGYVRRVGKEKWASALNH